jgi:hypothetical protein
MEVLQENSLCSYLKHAKMSFFFFYKIGNKRAEQVLSGGVNTRGRVEEVGKMCSRVNVVQIFVEK